MADAWGKKQTQKVDASCCGSGKTVLLYACSGGANVAEVADRATRPKAMPARERHA